VLLVALAVAAAFTGRQLPSSESFMPSLAPTASTASPAAGPPPRRDREPADPGVAKLDPQLRRAVRQAGDAAAADGVALTVDSGWRSPEHQQRLLDEAVAKYGSEQEAARWVATPRTSAHVSGDAVDIGPAAAAAWLSAHGAAYGLCQIYGNEPWHFELRLEATVHGCPPMYPDPTHDPRMRP
jgi:hypothetical protein